MKLSHLFYGHEYGEHGKLLSQLGVTHAIAKLAPDLTGDLPPWDYQALERSCHKFDDHQFRLIGLEGDQFDMNNIKLGLKGRDRDIEKYQMMLENMGKLGVKLLCYNFMAGIGWYRTNVRIKERGGALVSGFDLETANKLPLTEFGEVPAEKIWENYAYFIEKVMPVAERSGVRMALHPDDPPVSPLRGIGRIFTNGTAIRRALGLSQSPSHGLTFCQGSYQTMGEDLKRLIAEFGTLKKIFFIHIRDIIGTASRFRETFPDNGSTNMAEIFLSYKAIGFDGPIRSDHVPTMEGESNDHPGYEIKGNLFGIGYIKGIMDANGMTIE